jgi:signal transduction histidine kinase
VCANPALQRLTGFNSDLINQADWGSFLLEEHRAVASASWQRSLATGTPYRVQFSVGDTGVGLPAGSVNQILSAFFTIKPQGSGMGLAISRSIVEGSCGQLPNNPGLRISPVVV